jgi:hypothetical protein
MLRPEHKKEIQEKGLYDFICNNYWKLSKEDMKDLFKEFNHAVHSLDKDICKEAEKNMFDELEIDESEEE